MHTFLSPHLSTGRAYCFFPLSPRELLFCYIALGISLTHSVILLGIKCCWVHLQDLVGCLVHSKWSHPSRAQSCWFECQLLPSSRLGYFWCSANFSFKPTMPHISVVPSPSPKHNAFCQGEISQSISCIVFWLFSLPNTSKFCVFPIFPLLSRTNASVSSALPRELLPLPGPHWTPTLTGIWPWLRMPAPLFLLQPSFMVLIILRRVAHPDYLIDKIWLTHYPCKPPPSFH